MLKEIIRYILVVLFGALLIGVMLFVMYKPIAISESVDTLVIFGENTDLDEKHKAFVEDSCIYVAFSTFYKTVDSTLCFDEASQKVIITNHDNVVKLKVDSNVKSVNLEEKEIKHSVKKIDGVVFLPLTDLLDYYDLTLSYNSENKMVSIDKLGIDTSKVIYNNIPIFSDITTKSDVLQTLKRDDDVVVYDEALKHNRWYKIRSSAGNVGYIFKDAVDFDVNGSVSKEEKNEEIVDAKKVVMFWQYDSVVSVLQKNNIEGVNTVSPTTYEISNALGEVSGKISSGYVELAHSYGYNVWPIITNGIDSANYSSKDTSAIMNSELAREKLIKNIIAVIERDKLDGINIDFEQMKQEDKDMYTQFIRELAPIMRKISKTLSVDIYFTNYIDRAGIGEAADYVVLMGYDQNGSWSETSGSVSSVAWVEDNVKSLIEDSKIPENKIILGVPFYTRLWTEKAGEDRPQTTVYTMSQAANYIVQNSLELTYNEETRQNYFEYTRGSNVYKMWVEDATSMKNRVDVINKYSLAGISAWRIGFETSDIWPTITENLNNSK
ncbi:MAG: hypothetical protein IJ809_05370 [Clostridia bacterium]|nr:hypothetical protein [Clostridia bacterium]